MSIKCISLDLDGTLVSFDILSRGYISERNINAIKEFCEKSENQIVLATGRNVSRTLKVFEELCSKGISREKIPYLICLNGAVIVDTKKIEKSIGNQCFREDLCRRILEFLKTRKINFFIVNSKNEVIHSLNLFSFLIYKWIIKRNGGKRYLRPDFDMDNIQKIMMFTKLPTSRKWRKILVKEFGQDCYISHGCPFCLEISDNSINKFYGLKKVAEMIGLELDEIAAIGNEQNDIQCLENVGFGVGINLNDRLIYDKNKIDLNIVDKTGEGVSEAIYEMKKRGLW